MIKIYQDKRDKETGQFSISFYSKFNLYQILNLIKRQPVKKFKSCWKCDVSNIKELLEDLSTLKKETVHVDIGIFNYFFAKKKYQKKILKLRNSLDGINSGVELVPPNQLLPFQHIGVEFIREVKFGLIADKVGLGKTVQGFSAAQALWEDGEIQKCFIVVPSSLKKKWQRDIKNLLGVDAFILEGLKEERPKMYEKWMNGDDLFMIISYDTFRIDYNIYMHNFLPKLFGIIFDEVQRLKNKSTQRSEAMKSIASHPYCNARIGLSATYIETGLHDMFGAMYVIDDQVFGDNYMSFADKYLEISYMGKITGASKEGVKLARNRMKLCSVRRRKPQVKDQLQAFLPKVNENTLWLSLSKEEKQLYNEILEGVTDKIEDLEKKGQVSGAIAITQMQLLQQAVLSTEMFGYRVKKSSKIEALIEMLPEIIEENKVIIFCHFTKFIDFLEKALKKAGINCYAMHGSRKEGYDKNRQRVVDEFSESKDTHVLITSDILAEGIDCPAASYVINCDLLWNPAKMIQRAGRIDRLNQKAENLYVINLLAEGSIEELMLEVIYGRYDLALDVMDDGVEEDRIKKLRFSDIKKMLRRMI